MWAREFKDYPTDSMLKKEQVESGHGIVGCEMHEIFGWGQTYHIPPKKEKRGLFRTLLVSLFGHRDEI
jgi:hypothetical protein